MSKPSNKHHIEKFNNFTALQAADFEDFAHDTSNHIQDYKEVRKPLFITFKDNTTRSEPSIFTVVRRYRVGRTWYYRWFLDSTFVGPPTNFPTHATQPTRGGSVQFATVSDFPELARLSQSHTMAEPVMYAEETGTPGPEPTSWKQRHINSAFMRLSPIGGITLYYDDAPTLPTLDAPVTSNEQRLLNYLDYELRRGRYMNQGDSTWHTTDKGISVMGQQSEETYWVWTMIGGCERNIYLEDDER